MQMDNIHTFDAISSSVWQWAFLKLNSGWRDCMEPVGTEETLQYF